MRQSSCTPPVPARAPNRQQSSIEIELEDGIRVSCRQRREPFGAASGGQAVAGDAWPLVGEATQPSRATRDGSQRVDEMLADTAPTWTARRCRSDSQPPKPPPAARGAAARHRHPCRPFRLPACGGVLRPLGEDVNEILGRRNWTFAGLTPGARERRHLQLDRDRRSDPSRPGRRSASRDPADRRSPGGPHRQIAAVEPRRY